MQFTTTLVNVVTQKNMAHTLSYTEYLKIGDTPAVIRIDHEHVSVSVFLNSWTVLINKTRAEILSEGLQVKSTTICADDYQKVRNAILDQVSIIFEGRF